MDKLPPEILHRVFTHLSLYERLICLVVCRNWWSVLDRYSLFYSISLGMDEDYDGSGVYRFLDTIKSLPHRAAQVEEVTLAFDSDEHFNRRTLLNIFPNARVMQLYPAYYPQTSTFKYSEKHIDITHSNSKIEYLGDFHQCEFLSQMITSKLSYRLKTLSLNFCRLLDTPLTISQLKDLPVLKALILSGPKISLGDLETIHQNVPSIQEFALHHMFLKFGKAPMDIVPATPVQKFTFTFGQYADSNTHVQFYQYISEKYINMTDVRYSDHMFEYGSEDSKRIYLNGILDFLKVIGPRQSKLTFFSLPDGVDPFEALDKVGSRIKGMHFQHCEGGTTLKYLSRSNQGKYIERLTLDTKMDSIHHLKNMTALTTLAISSYDDLPVHLADHLDACPPALKTLTISGKHLVAPPFKRSLDSIETLCIHFNTVTGDIGDILSSCFPNLVELTYTGPIIENTNITLKSLRFQKALFTFPHKRFLHGFSFMSPNQTEPQFYLCSLKEKESVQRKDIDHLPLLSVVSLTEKKLRMSRSIHVLPC